MDGCGRFADNIFVERLWRSLRYEEVYLKAYENVAQARQGIAAYFEFYNHERLHQALDYRAPRQVLEEVDLWLKKGYVSDLMYDYRLAPAAGMDISEFVKDLESARALKGK